MSTSPLYLIDASIYIFRSWFSLSETIIGKDDQPVNALCGYFDFLTRFVGETRPRHIVVAFDSRSGQSFRNDIHPGYKANRDPTPPALKRQFALCRLLTRSIGISETAREQYEADDLIGTLAARAQAQGRPVVIVSGDKDLAQLVGKSDIWWDYSRGTRLNYEGVKRQFGVYPDQIADFLAIAGDASDNISGVQGVGRVTAARLLEHFGSLPRMLERIEEIHQVKVRGAKRVAGLIESCAHTLAVARQLTGIDCAVPLSEDFPTQAGPPNKASFESLKEQIGFRPYRQRQYERCLKSLGLE